MSGTSADAHQWADADVYVSFNLAATIPANVATAFGSQWELVGLLDGDAGFTFSRNEDVNDHFAWGGVLMRTTRQHFKEEVKFTAFEWNDTTWRLRNPGSVAGSLVVPRPESILIGFQTTDTDTGEKHRLISAGHAQVSLDGDVTVTEADMSALPFVATIFPDTSVSPARLWFEQQSATVGS